MAPCFQGTAVHPQARRASRPPTAVGKEAPAASAVTACVSGPVGLWGGGHWQCDPGDMVSAPHRVPSV